MEPFVPEQPPEVRMYVCGPTVYNRAHLGNFRTFVATDLLRRALKFTGHTVREVMNLTDVEDRIIRFAADASTDLEGLHREVDRRVPCRHGDASHGAARALAEGHRPHRRR